MKSLAKKKKNSNVLSIADNPRFEPKETIEIAMPKNNRSTYSVYTLNEKCFGYPEGAKIVVREEFDPSEIDAQTIVVVSDGQCVAAGVTENVTAIVDFIQLDLRRAK